MKINYHKFLELNIQATSPDGHTLGCFWSIQSAVELFLQTRDEHNITEQQKNLLLELGVLELTEEEKASQTIVGPFKFNSNGPKDTV